MYQTGENRFSKLWKNHLKTNNRLSEKRLCSFDMKNFKASCHYF